MINTAESPLEIFMETLGMCMAELIRWHIEHDFKEIHCLMLGFVRRFENLQ